MSPIGNVILVVEPDVTSFVSQLQEAIEAEGAESIVVRDPAAAMARCKRFEFSVALVNVRHHDMVGRLIMPAMLYDPADGFATVIARLRAMLAQRPRG
jgi:DNA-binding response OmpR family regulator